MQTHWSSGTIIHKVLAEYYQSRMTNERLTLKQIHELFETHWKQTAQNRDDIQYKEGKNFETLLSEGRDLLTAYYHKLPDDEYKVIAIEEPFVFYLPELEVPHHRLYRSDGGGRFRDDHHYGLEDSRPGLLHG